MAPARLLLALLGAAAGAARAQPALPDAPATPVLVLGLSFRANLGGTVPPACNASCVRAGFWEGAAPLFAAASGGALSFVPGLERAARLEAYASDLGCRRGAWAAEALAGADASAFPLQIFALPAEAGGGSCGRFAAEAEPLAGGCRVWVRAGGGAALGAWAGALGACLGHAPAALPGGACDPADALCPGAPAGRGLLPPHRAARGWLPARPLAAGAGVLGPAEVLELAAAEDGAGWQFFAGGPGAFAYSRAPGGPLVRRAALAPGQGLDLPAAGLFFGLGARGPWPAPAGLAFWAELCARGAGALALGRVRGAPGPAPAGFRRLAAELALFNRDRRCPPRGATALFRPDAPLACNLVEVFVAPDVNPAETSYRVSDADGAVFLAGGGSNSTVYCGPAGAPLVAAFEDAGGDGLCCLYGGGSYYSIRVGGGEVRRGGDFGAGEAVGFDNSPAWNFPPVTSGGRGLARATVFVAEKGAVAGVADAGWASGVLEEASAPAAPWTFIAAAGGLAAAGAFLLFVGAALGRRASRQRLLRGEGPARVVTLFSAIAPAPCRSAAEAAPQQDAGAKARARSPSAPC